MRLSTILAIAVAVALIAGAGVLWPNDANVCNPSRLPSLTGRVETMGKETVHDTGRCWIVRVRDPRTGTLYKVPFESEAETLKHPIGSTYTR